jgi:hypothetical protein
MIGITTRGDCMMHIAKVEVTIIIVQESKTAIQERCDINAHAAPDTVLVLDALAAAVGFGGMGDELVKWL